MTTQLLVTLASVGGLTALAWLVRRAALSQLCPLCAGVAGTWIGLFLAHGAGLPVDPRLPAILMGGSVVGLAGVGERALAGRAPGAVLAWKTAFVVTGFATAYALLLAAWLPAALGGAALAVLLAGPRFATGRGAAPAPTEGQSRVLAELKNCC